MEEEKAAAYYDELTRKGEGAARFKQGLGFSTTTNSDVVVPKPGSALASSSSFLSNFVRASSPSKTSEFEKQAQLQSIQNKLKKKPNSSSEEPSRVSDRDSSRRRSRSRSGSRERRRDRDSRSSRRRSRSRDKYRERDRDSRRRSRSRERNRDRDDERRRRKRSRSRGRSRSISPRERRSDKRNGSDVVGDPRRVNKVSKEKNAGVDYARLIPGYDKMSPADRVKAKMKLQLSETSEKDSEKGVGWERFEFNKDAPLDDEEIEVAEDDASLVKHIGQSFRFSTVEARREEQIQAAHDEAMFGTSAAPPPVVSDSEPEKEDNEKDEKRKGLVSSLLSESVLAKRKGSWRDRVQLQDS